MDQDYTPDAWDDIEGVAPPAETLELFGHDNALETLVRNYRNKRLHHAWLLSGPKGIGKATLALRFAEFLLRNPEPEKAADHIEMLNDAIHSQVAKGAHPNVLILRKPWDQKSKKFKTQITVDEIRKTASFLQTASGANAWRIVIVDPADDMNNSAANALLKILEEPPARTLFFVLAHSPRGLLPTIRSRCQVLPIKPLMDADMVSVLSHHPLTSDLPDSEIENLIHHAKGSPKRAFLLAQSGVLETLTNFLKIISQKQADIGQLHFLAGQLAPAAKSGEYALFMDLIYDHIVDNARTLAVNDQVSMDRVSKWAAIWDKTREANMRAETWNMDKKQVILDLFNDLRAA